MPHTLIYERTENTKKIRKLTIISKYYRNAFQFKCAAFFTLKYSYLLQVCFEFQHNNSDANLASFRSEFQHDF